MKKVEGGIQGLLSLQQVTQSPVNHMHSVFVSLEVELHNAIGYKVVTFSLSQTQTSLYSPISQLTAEVQHEGPGALVA